MLTCMGCSPGYGVWRVRISHMLIPKLYTSAFSVYLCPEMTSGAIQWKVPHWAVMRPEDVGTLKRDRPKSDTWGVAKVHRGRHDGMRLLVRRYEVDDRGQGQNRRHTACTWFREQTYLDSPSLIDKQVQRLQVSMDDRRTVGVQDCIIVTHTPAPAPAPA